MHVPREPVNSGAAISFITLDRFVYSNGQVEKCESENGAAYKLQLPEPIKSSDGKMDVLETRAKANQIQTYMQDMLNHERLVYCRYGKNYISQVTKH